MLHAPEWITAWRLKQAYSLSDFDVISLVQSLASAGHVSLHAAWENFKNFFLLPKIQSLPDHWRSTFDDLDFNSDSPSWIERVWFGEKRELLNMLRVVAPQTDRKNIESAVSNLYYEIYESDTEPKIQKKDFCDSFFYCEGETNNAFFDKIFTESLVFNKLAAIERLEYARYPFVAETKGITKELVNAVRECTSSAPILPLENHSTQANPSISTGSAKGNTRIEATRQACNTVRAEIEQGKHGFQVNGEYKTNHDHFQDAVMAILGDTKPHRETVNEEWKKVSQNIKHTGRVPEQ